MIIPLTQGKSAIIDDEDHEKVGKLKWQYFLSKRQEYAYHGFSSGKSISMHRLILGLFENDELMVDHINGNGLDNRKCNLRVCTNKQNQANAKLSVANSSGYKGVIWHKNHKRVKRWRASIRNGEKRIHLGYFNSPEDAAKAYDKAAIKLHGEFALTNEKMGKFSHLIYKANE